MDYSQVTPSKKFIAGDMPDLGLDEDLDAPYRVYVLRCKNALYVGWAKTQDVRQRICDHFSAAGAGFTKRFPPIEVCLLLPARNAAAEAYVYFALLETKPEAFVGGWTQTSWNPSPMVHLLTKEARCNLKGTCFTCHKQGHRAAECSRGNSDVQTCFYPCKAAGCTSKLYLTTTGRTPTNLVAAAQAAAVNGDADVSAGLISHAASPPSSQSTLNFHESRPQTESSSSSSGFPRSPVEGQPPLKKQRSKDHEIADVSFEGAWFAARKKRRGGKLEELASLRDIVSLIKTKKSIAAEKHLDDRINVWLRRYGKTNPKDCVLNNDEFSSRKGGGSGGVGVTKTFALAIYGELASA